MITPSKDKPAPDFFNPKCLRFSSAFRSHQTGRIYTYYACETYPGTNRFKVRLWINDVQEPDRTFEGLDNTHAYINTLP